MSNYPEVLCSKDYLLAKNFRTTPSPFRKISISTKNFRLFQKWLLIKINRQLSQIVNFTKWLEHPYYEHFSSIRVFDSDEFGSIPIFYHFRFIYL